MTTQPNLTCPSCKQPITDVHDMEACKPIDDLKPFEHGQEGTHIACQNRLLKEGEKAHCCYCSWHKECDFEKQPKWEECRIAEHIPTDDGQYCKCGYFARRKSGDDEESIGESSNHENKSTMAHGFKPKWEEELRKQILSTDDLHYDHPIDEPLKGTFYIDGYELEQFICTHFIPKSELPVAMGVSQWQQYGEKYGYWKFFENKVKSELREKIEGMNRTQYIDPIITPSDFTLGYDQGLEDTKKLLE